MSIVHSVRINAGQRDAARACAVWIYVCFVLLIYYVPDIEYRHGADYKILCIHLPNAVTIYVLFSVCAAYAIARLCTGYECDLRNQTTWGYISTLNGLSTGTLWGWAQWGAVPLSDPKVVLLVLLLVYYATNVLLRDTILHAYYTLSYTLTIPALKYSVAWYSELHQHPSTYLLHVYIGDTTVLVTTIYTSAMLSMYNATPTNTEMDLLIKTR